MRGRLELQIDYTLEDGKVVLTRDFLLRRGYCCNHRCRNCPYKGAPDEADLKIVVSEE
jgi:hypothetical protein